MCKHVHIYASVYVCVYILLNQVCVFLLQARVALFLSGSIKQPVQAAHGMM